MYEYVEQCTLELKATNPGYKPKIVLGGDTKTKSEAEELQDCNKSMVSLVSSKTISDMRVKPVDGNQKSEAPAGVIFTQNQNFEIQSQYDTGLAAMDIPKINESLQKEERSSLAQKSATQVIQGEV